MENVQEIRDIINACVPSGFLSVAEEDKYSIDIETEEQDEYFLVLGNKPRLFRDVDKNGSEFFVIVQKQGSRSHINDRVVFQKLLCHNIY